MFNWDPQALDMLDQLCSPPMLPSICKTITTLLQIPAGSPQVHSSTGVTGLHKSASAKAVATPLCHISPTTASCQIEEVSSSRLHVQKLLFLLPLLRRLHRTLLGQHVSQAVESHPCGVQTDVGLSLCAASTSLLCPEESLVSKKSEEGCSLEGNAACWQQAHHAVCRQISLIVTDPAFPISAAANNTAVERMSVRAGIGVGLSTAAAAEGTAVSVVGSDRSLVVKADQTVTGYLLGLTRDTTAALPLLVQLQEAAETHFVINTGITLPSPSTSRCNQPTSLGQVAASCVSAVALLAQALTASMTVMPFSQLHCVESNIRLAEPACRITVQHTFNTAAADAAAAPAATAITRPGTPTRAAAAEAAGALKPDAGGPHSESSCWLKVTSAWLQLGVVVLEAGAGKNSSLTTSTHAALHREWTLGLQGLVESAGENG